MDRLAPLLTLPDGTLEEVASPLHRIRIVKHEGQIHFYFVNADGALDGPMSRIDLRRPLHLVAEYTQAAMLALLWQPAPRHACMLGLAGGRISLVLGHHFPELVINNVDIDPAVGPLAERYFGMRFGERQRLFTADARAFLATTQQQYDIIIMDAFRDASDDLDHLATLEFYAACTRRMVQNGVLAANMLASDPHFAAKLAAFGTSFRHAWAAPHRHGVVLLGNNQARLRPKELVQRAHALHVQHGFDFPFVARAESLVPLREYRQHALAGRSDAPLTDQQPTDTHVE